MKSIANQYRDLKEGKMSQSNFMRNLRMSMPQYVTNVTSFNDAVRILKNKAILNEADINELSPQTKYNAAMKAVDKINAASSTSDSTYTKALRQGNKFAQQIDPILKKAVEDFGESLGFETVIEKATTGSKYEPIIQIRMGKGLGNPSIKVTITKDTDKIEGRVNLPDEAAERKLGNLIKQIQQKELDVELKEEYGEEDELDAMIAKMEKEKEEEEAIKSGFGIQDPLEEANGEFPRDPREMAQAIADEFKEELLSLSGREREKMAISRAYEKILNSGHPKAKIIARNLAFGYADEDWPMDYVSTLNDILDKMEDDDISTMTSEPKVPEMPIFKGTRDALDDLSIREGRKKKEPKKELHPNQIHPQELRMGMRVELEHTDDLDKAKKIALDHLAENPFYYTALKLAGVESPSAPKVKAPVEKKAKKKKEAVELVDKANAMQKVKMPKAIKEVYTAAALPGEEINDTTKKVVQYIDSDIANPTLKALSKDISLQNLRDNRTLLRYRYWEPLPDNAIRALELQFKVEGDTDIDDDTAPREFYILSSKPSTAKDLGSSLEMGANKAGKMDAFKEALEKLVREAVTEYYYDGRDNLTAVTDDTK